MTMSMLQFSRKLYSLDTLDARFTTSSRTPPQATASKIDLAKPTSISQEPHCVSLGGNEPKESVREIRTPRWRKVEYYIYLLSVFVLASMMVKAAVEISSRMSTLFVKLMNWIN